MKNRSVRKNAYIFLLFLGIVSMLSDFTHEGARSIYGPFLSIVGATALVVSITSGLGEFIGQALRIVTGVVADKTKKYWTMMIIGYAVNLLAIPMLALVTKDGWILAVGLILLERIGKAIRAPAKSTLTSFVGHEIGAGKAFAINEALDQIGAFLGPMFLFIVLTIRGEGDPFTNYRFAFGLLGIVAIATLTVLMIAKSKYPNPEHFDQSKIQDHKLMKNKLFWIYMVGIGFIAAGFIDYPLIAFHLGNTSSFPLSYIPLFYSVAMGVDALSALFFGWMFDRKGLLSLIMAILVSSLFAPLIFLFDSSAVIIGGIVLWGVGMGAQESILKSVVATIIPKEKRATAYGVFNALFGLTWFLGSLIIGLLYQYSIIAIVIFSVSMEFISLPILYLVHQKLKIQLIKEVS